MHTIINRTDCINDTRRKSSDDTLTHFTTLSKQFNITTKATKLNEGLNQLLRPSFRQPVCATCSPHLRTRRRQTNMFTVAIPLLDSNLFASEGLMTDEWLICDNWQSSFDPYLQYSHVAITYGFQRMGLRILHL